MTVGLDTLTKLAPKNALLTSLYLGHRRWSEGVPPFADLDWCHSVLGRLGCSRPADTLPLDVEVIGINKEVKILERNEGVEGGDDKQKTSDEEEAGGSELRTKES